MCQETILSFGLCLLFVLSPVTEHKEYINPNTLDQSLFNSTETTYVIKGRVDLHGKTYRIPEGCIIDLRKGSLVNGSIIGTNTRLKKPKSASIGVKVSGSWIIHSINDSFFNPEYLSDSMIISCINALQSDNIKQRITLEKPTYTCSIPRNDGALLILCSNTSLRMKTVISIEGNDFTSYNIIRILGKENVSVSGGELHGDVGNHTYVPNNTSQWGHGLNIYSSSGVKVSNITITHCIGDGIAISGGKEEHIGEYGLASTDIQVNNVISRFNRRQGLSIIHASDVKVIGCVFSDTGIIESQSPSAGIDIEPNTEAPYFQAVRNVIIRDCIIERNVGYGFLTNHFESHNGVKSINNASVNNCLIDSRVVLHTGGINFQNSTMKELSIIAEKDPIIGSAFTGCIISGGNGVQFYCPNSGKDVSTMVGDLVFENCSISVPANVDRNASPSILWCKGRPSRMRKVIFKNCRITIPESAPDGYGFVEASDSDISFENCRISIPGRYFPTDKVQHSSCRIVSRNINM